MDCVPDSADTWNRVNSEVHHNSQYATGLRNLPGRQLQVPLPDPEKNTLLNSVLRTCFCQACCEEGYDAGSVARQDEVEMKKRVA